jgi:DMSO/TMAO reductase YedYZ molybdopterin-dependent catalytic subunit
MADLKSAFEPVEMIAVNHCSGNGRGFFEPRVPGGQFANGAMGNARWRGVPLKAVLAKAGVQAGAVQVSLQGLDQPVVPETPAFVKALDLDHALDGEVMVAYAMNGEDLPWLNGFPLRLVAPGCYGTYWIKHLAKIAVLDAPLDNFWMTKAYRIPNNACACVEPGAAQPSTAPIGRLNVRSFLTSVADGATVPANQPLALRGIAFDGGSGIADVVVSTDGGTSWNGAALGEELGRYSFREWKGSVTLPPGKHQIKVALSIAQASRSRSSRCGIRRVICAMWSRPRV